MFILYHYNAQKSKDIKERIMKYIIELYSFRDLINLTMPNYPNFLLNELNLDLYKLTMQVKLNLDELLIGGNFETNNYTPTEDDLFPKTNKGAVM